MNLTKSIVTDLKASETHFEGSVVLEGATVKDGVNLVGAKIDGVLKFDGGQFVGKDTAPTLSGDC